VLDEIEREREVLARYPFSISSWVNYTEVLDSDLRSSTGGVYHDKYLDNYIVGNTVNAVANLSVLSSIAVMVVPTAELPVGERSSAVLLQEEISKSEGFRYYASAAFIVRCAAKAGLSLPAQTPVAEKAEVVQACYAGPHTDSDGVTRYGSGPAELSGKSSPDPTAPYSAARYAEVVGGKVTAERIVTGPNGEKVTTVRMTDGCYGQAMSALFGNADAYVQYSADVSLLESLSMATSQTVWKSPDVQPAIASWVGCMNAAGYKFKHPQDPIMLDWTDAKLDTATAVADVACRVETKFEPTFVAAETKLQVAALAKYPGLVARLQSTMATIRSSQASNPLV
jgi:hypothetical protein